MKPKPRKAKSLGQVACEAYYGFTPQADWSWEPPDMQRDWHRVARAVVKEHEKRLWAKAASGNGSTWTVKNRNR